LYGQTVLDAYIAYATNDNSYVLFTNRPTEFKYSLLAEDGSPSTVIESNYGSPDLFVNGSQYVINYGTTTRDELHTELVRNQMILEVHQGATTSNWTDFGFSNYGTRELNGNVSEIILYNSNQSSNRTGIESNINDYYSIYTPSTTPTSQSIAVYGNAINESIDLNANYTDLKEIIIYE
jgi:hypothetical protein